MFDLRVLVSLRLVRGTLVSTGMNIFSFGIQIDMRVSLSLTYVACPFEKKRFGDNTASIMAVP